MKYLQYLIPPFLRKIDHYLLQRYPVLWETKIAYVLFYSAVVANLALLSVGFLVPVSQSYVPDYEMFTTNILVWTGILVFLALGYYTYLQSFIRIRVYTLRENLLRVGLYAVAVLSILSNMLVLPNTVAYRVRSLYSAEQLKKDREEILKAEILKDFVYKLYDAQAHRIASPTDAEPMQQPTREDIIAYLKKSPLNKNGAVDSYLRDFIFLEKSAIYLQKGLLRRETIEGNLDWHPTLRFELTHTLSDEVSYESDRRFQGNASYELNLPHIAKIYSKYPPLVLKRSEYRRYYDEFQFHVYKSLQNIEKYHKANLFLQSKLWYHHRDHSYKKTGHLQQLLLTQSFSQDLRIFLDNLYKNSGIFYQNDTKHWIACIDLLSNKSRVDSYAKDVTPLIEAMPNTLYLPYLVLILGLSLFVLVSKAFTFRTLFISAVGIIATVISAGFSLAWLFYQFPTLEHYFSRYNSYGAFDYSRMMQFMWAFGHILLAIVVCAGVFGGYVLRYHLHKKWFETLWVYFINGSFVATFFWFVFGLFDGMEGRDTHTYMRDNTIYIAIYFVFATCIFAMYSVYNKMMGLPLKR